MTNDELAYRLNDAWAVLRTIPHSHRATNPNTGRAVNLSGLADDCLEAAGLLRRLPDAK